MFDFIFAYFFFFLAYPIVLVSIAIEDPFSFFIWIMIAVVGIWFLLGKAENILVKLFLCIWIMPGTIVCGAAGIAPWIMTIQWAFNDGSCSNAFSLGLTLMFNLVIVFGAAKLYSLLKSRRGHA